MLKDATPNDFDTISRINQAGQPGVCPLSLDDINQHHQAASLCCVWMHNNQCTGYVIAYDYTKNYDGEEFNWFVQNIDGSFLYIDQIAIDAQCRANGLGSQFYTQLKDFAYRHQYTNLVCEVNLEPPNPISMAFHQKNGFVEIGQLRVSDGRYVALMQMQVYHLSITHT